MDRMFNSIEELMLYIQKEIPITLEILAEEVKEILRDNVQRLWYDRPYTPTLYERTLEYINSIVCGKATQVRNGVFEIEIYFDTNLIHPYSNEGNYWGQHESLSGEDVSDYIPTWIEDGNNNSPKFSYEGVHPKEITKQWLEDTNYLRDRMIEILGNYGFGCSII